CTKVADDRVRDGRALERHADQDFLRRLNPFLDRGGHFLRLADAEADDAVPIADDDERAEGQVLAALHDFRHAVDRHDSVLDIELARIDSLTSAHLKLQARFAGRVGNGANAPVIQESAAIEHDAFDAFADRPFSNSLPDGLRAFDVPTAPALG